MTLGRWVCPLCRWGLDVTGSGVVSAYKDDIIKFHLNLHAKHSKEDLFKALNSAAENKELPAAVADKYESFMKTVEAIEAALEKKKIE